MAAKGELTPRRKAFVKAYCGEARGNATLAARLAGFKHPKQAGAELLEQPVVQAAIARRPLRPDIADPDEVRAQVSAILRDPKATNKERLKAAEVLAKVLPGLAVAIKTEVSGPDGGPMKVAQVEGLTDEQLEQEIRRVRAIIEAGESPSG